MGCVDVKGEDALIRNFPLLKKKGKEMYLSIMSMGERVLEFWRKKNLKSFQRES